MNEKFATSAGFEAYRKYIAVKLHFNDCDYDFIKYNGVISAKYSSYLKRTDGQFFESLARTKKKSEIVPFFLANFVVNGNLWIGNIIFNQETEEIYSEWRRVFDALIYHVSRDWRAMNDFLEAENLSFNQLFEIKDTHPIMLRLMLQKYISFETYTITNMLLHYGNVFDVKMKGDMIYEPVSFRSKKYEAFLHHLPLQKYKKLCCKIFVDNKQ